MKEIRDEFEEFKSEGGHKIPAVVSEHITSHVHRDLNPAAWLLFTKISFVHLGVGFLTLSLCPQFGFRALGDGMGLMDTFMRLGPHGCMVACGFFFLGMSLLTAALVLRPEEVRALRRQRMLQIPVLALASLGFFFLVNSQVMAFGLVVPWFFGSVLGANLLLEVVWKSRVRASPAASRA